MTITKAQLIEAIKALPQQEFTSIDELLEEIILIAKIESGLQQITEGKVIQEEELDKAIEQW